jgi:hypothetical protein
MKSKINSIVFKNEYSPNSGGTLYCYNVSMQDGASGLLYTKTKDYYKEGEEVEYTQEASGKFKFDKVNNNKPAYKPKPPLGGFQPQQHTITYYLGFTMGFAKDMVIEEFRKDPKAKEINSERFRMLCTDAYIIAEELFNKDKEE